MTRQDILENQVKFVYLGVGSNLGNKKNNIEKVKFELIKNNIKILQSSSYYESLSWPNPKKPKFFNIVLKVSTNLSPLKLLKKCKEIEVYLNIYIIQLRVTFNNLLLLLVYIAAAICSLIFLYA